MADAQEALLTILWYKWGMSKWITHQYEDEDNWYVALVDDRHVVLRVHPIFFANPREAARAADRLNARDEAVA